MKTHRRGPRLTLSGPFLLMLGALANGPLEASSPTVELNVPGLLTSAADPDRLHATGTLTTGVGRPGYELAAPFAFLKIDYGTSECCAYRVDRVDLQLRRFLHVDRSGPYVGAIARLSRVEGSDRETGRPRAFARAGVGIAVGHRQSLTRDGRLYAGVGLNVGYFLDRPEPVATGAVGVELFGPSDNGARGFFNVELLKLGYRF